MTGFPRSDFVSRGLPVDQGLNEMGPTGKWRGSWQFRVVRSRGFELPLGSEKEQVEERAS